MSAKEMFEKLGYKLTRNDDLFITYSHTLKHDKKYYYAITFELKYKQIKIERYRSELLRQLFSKEDMIGLYLDDVQAINKQIDELGWNNE
ncbi:MAG: hypothetical protein HFI86_02125 [Bacilli bacterium]|nr:hypothetical protein [Bacilli bacterium]